MSRTFRRVLMKRGYDFNQSALWRAGRRRMMQRLSRLIQFARTSNDFGLETVSLGQRQRPRALGGFIRLDEFSGLGIRRRQRVQKRGTIAA